MAERRSPWLIAAIFCDVQQEPGGDGEQAGGNLYAIRPSNFARLQVERASFSPDESIDVPMYLAITGGEANRQHQVRLVVRDPAGNEQRTDEYWVRFPGVPGAVLDTLVQVPLLPVRSGVFWVDVLLDGEPLTTVPFRLELQYTG